MRVIATKRTVSEGSAALEDVDLLLPPAQLPAILRDADALVLACPQTPDTEGLIGRGELRAMKRGAVLVNISRGAVVDEPALVEALRDGALGGAALECGPAVRACCGYLTSTGSGGRSTYKATPSSTTRPRSVRSWMPCTNSARTATCTNRSIRSRTRRRSG